MKKLPIIFAVAAVMATAFVIWRVQSRSAPANALELQGNVDIRQISLAFEGGGRVVELRVSEGDQVKAGDVVGRLDARTLTLQVEQAQAQIQVQEQTLKRLQNGSRPQELAQARSRVKAAEADAIRAEQDLVRQKDLASATQGRGISAQELDRASSNLAIAQAKVSEQRESLRLAELGPRTEEVAGAQAQLKVAKSQLALLQYQLGQTELKAPADAIVRSRLLEPGDMATPQRPVFALALTRPKWVRVYVEESDLGKVRPGMPARVVTDSHPDQAISGKVGYISATAEFTPKSVQTRELRTSLVYEVRIQVEDPADQLRLGQPATVYLHMDSRQ